MRRIQVISEASMKDVLNTMVQAVGAQAIAMGAVDNRVTALKRTLARQFPDIADELKAQIEEEQEQSRKGIYELQVTLAKVREAISQLPEAQGNAEVKVARKRSASKAPAGAAGKSRRSR
jgi:hypothetical protein